MSGPSQIQTISNSTASISVDLNGGAIVDFHLHEDGINPLTFKREADNFRGHFLCLGRWGPPSAGEAAAGITTHGEAVKNTWDLQPSSPKNEMRMQVTAPLEGLYVNRLMILDEENAVFEVTESVTNINPLGRLFNMVQHPTLAAPFLTNETVVHCNADRGFNYKLSKKPLEFTAKWPFGALENGDYRDIMNLHKPDKPYSSVFSFTIKKDAKFGWITAYNPELKLIIGYLWQRGDYPWISLWQDFDGDNIRCRGLEFGTTGMHKSYKDIIAEGNHRVFDEDSYKYIDAGETQTRSYLAFMSKAPGGFTSGGHVSFENNSIVITDIETGKQITIQTTLKANGISK